MRRLFVIIVFLITTVVGCGSSYGRYPYGDRYGNHNGSGYGSNYGAAQAYDYGYREGYEHGYADRRKGNDFNYQHDRRFQSGVSRDRYINDRFRAGYVRGYQEGYYGRAYR